MHQRSTDTRCLIPHLEKLKSQLGKLPGIIIADAGYGGEENYEYLDQNEIEAIIKYSTYHREKSKVWQKDISKIDNWTSNRYYRSASCEDCPFKPQCTLAQGDREIRVRIKYLQLKNQASQRLQSKEGYALAVRRRIEPEPVFGALKNNRGFKRFLLRGLPKVSLEVGCFSLAHNLLKKASVDAKNRGAKRIQIALLLDF
nr:transposase [Cohnella terricola]